MKSATLYPAPGLVLLIPMPEFQDLFLREGPYGSRPPVLTWCYSTITDRDWWGMPSQSLCPHEPIRRALVLAEKDQPFAESCDRVSRVLGWTPTLHLTMDDVNQLLDRCVDKGLAVRELPVCVSR